MAEADGAAGLAGLAASWVDALNPAVLGVAQSVPQLCFAGRDGHHRIHVARQYQPGNFVLSAVCFDGYLTY